MTSDTSSADRILRIGAWITALGLVFTVIACLPLLIPSVTMPSALWGLSMLTGVGLVVVFVGLVAGARQRRSRR